MEDNYNGILSLLVNSKVDRTPTKSENYAIQTYEIHEEFQNRNKKLTKLLDSYIEQRGERVKVNKGLKIFVFWFFIVLLGVLTISVIIFIMCNIRQSGDKSFSVSLITVSVTYLASLIAVFEIISKYLFPIDEEKDTVSMIQTVLNNDFKVEELISKFEHNQDKTFEKFTMIKRLYEDKILTDEEFAEAKKALIEELKKENK